MKIFTLVTLLSSTLVYNMVGVLDQNAMKTLGFVAEMGNKLRFHHKNTANNTDLHMILPTFVLVLRDLTKIVVVDGLQVSPNEYLEHALREKTGKTDVNKDTKDCIKRFFPTRKCFILPLPGEPKLIEKLSQVPFNTTSSDFKEKTSAFVNFICSQEPKRLGLKPVKGQLFASLAFALVDRIEHEQTDVDKALTNVAIEENRRVGQTAAKLFKERLSKIRLPISAKRLQQHYIDASNRAFDFVFRHSITDELNSNVAFNTAKGEMEPILQKLRGLNKSLLRQRCDEILQMYPHQIEPKDANTYFYEKGGIDFYKTELKQFQQKYNQELLEFEGEPETLQAWCDFLERLLPIEQILLSAEKDKQGQMTQELRKQSLEVERYKQKMKEMEELHEQKLKEKTDAFKRELKARREEFYNETMKIVSEMFKDQTERNKFLEEGKHAKKSKLNICAVM